MRRALARLEHTCALNPCRAVMDVSATCGKLVGDMIRLLIIATAFALCLQATPTRAQQAERQCGSMDVVFVLDVSGSMWGALLSIQRQSIRLLDDIEQLSGGDYRLGLVVFREYIQVLDDLNASPTPSTKKESVAHNLSRLGAAGGEQIPEASADALATVLNRLPPDGEYRIGNFDGAFEGDVRIVILITDQLPGGFDDLYTPGEDDALADNLARQAASMNIRISAVYVPTPVWPEAEVERIMQNYANRTEGIYIRTDRRGEGVGDGIADILASCGERLMS
ncbi:MAG: vWA domain-containing protein [Pseudomonadota bacterium]